MRLVEGSAASTKVYQGDPIEVAGRYQAAGAELIHVVDLDGAFLGAASDNQMIIKRICSEVSIPIEVGGGVRTIADVDNLIRNIGARYVILGTVAVERPDILAEAITEFGDSIMAGIDARGPEVATRGWTERTTSDARSLAREMAEMGVGRIIYTDITRDGKLAGPNLDMTRELARAAGIRVTASGGISSLDDITRLCELEPDGVDSAIVGKALYENRFTLEEAIGRTRQARRSSEEVG